MVLDDRGGDERGDRRTAENRIRWDCRERTACGVSSNSASDATRRAEPAPKSHVKRGKDSRAGPPYRCDSLRPELLCLAPDPAGVAVDEGGLGGFAGGLEDFLGDGVVAGEADFGDVVAEEPGLAGGGGRNGFF